MKNHTAYWVAGAVGIAALLLIWKKNQANTALDLVEGVGGTSNAGFYSPYYTTNPGISDNPRILNGGPSSIINVNVTDALYGSLSNQYIPMFGFVGVTAIGAQ